MNILIIEDILIPREHRYRRSNVVFQNKFRFIEIFLIQAIICVHESSSFLRSFRIVYRSTLVAVFDFNCQEVNLQNQWLIQERALISETLFNSKMMLIFSVKKRHKTESCINYEYPSVHLHFGLFRLADLAHAQNYPTLHTSLLCNAIYWQYMK